MRLLLLRLLCGLCFLGGSSSSFAADFFWTANFSGHIKTGPSPSSACSASISSYNANQAPDTPPVTLTRTIKRSDTQFTCMWGYQGSEVTGFGATRSGDSCPAGHDYDSDTGECVPPPVDCSTAGPGIFSKTGSIINSDGKNYVVTQGGGTVCYGQCNHTLSNSASSCYSSGDGNGFCNYIGTPDGTNCTGTDAPLGRTGDPLNPPDTPNVPPSDPNDPGCPPGYGWSGTTCAKNPDDNGNPPGDGGDGGDTGGGGGGGGGGGNDGGDGSGGGGGDTGGGDGGDGDGGDTGGGLPGGGVPGGGGSGGGSGDEGEDPVSSVGGESCSATITCEGDAIQCAILRSQKKQTCADEEARDYSKAAPTINAEIAKSEYQLKEETVDANGFFNMGTRFYSSTCPAPQSLHIETFGLTIQLSYQPLCDFAEALSYIVVAMASLFFMVYVGRSFGDE